MHSRLARSMLTVLAFWSVRLSSPGPVGGRGRGRERGQRRTGSLLGSAAMPTPVDPAAVLALLEENDGRPVKAKELSKRLGLSADDRSTVREALRTLVAEGRVIQLEGRRYVLPRAGSVLSG